MRFVYLLAVAFVAVHCNSAAYSSDNEIDYANDIQPIFDKYCTGCHTADDANGGLVLDSFSSLLEGGEHGAVVTAGVPASSRLLLMTTGELEPKMPPDDMEGPTEDEVVLLRRWIEAEARGPASDLMLNRKLRTPEVRAAENKNTPVTALALSPDGTTLAVARFSKIDLLDAVSEDLRSRLDDLPGKVNDARFSQDGEYLVIGSGITGLYGVARIVRIATGETILEISGHRDTLYAAVMSPDGSLLATGGYDRDIHLWNRSDGTLVRTLKGHNGAIYDLAFSADGQVLASASADETVKLWRVSDGERLDTLSQPQGEVWCVAFSPDDSFIVAASGDNRFRVWQFESKSQPKINRLVESRFADEAPLVRLAFADRGQQLLVASQSGRIGLFETNGWNKVGDIVSGYDAITELIVSEKDRSLTFSTMDGKLERLQLSHENQARTAGENEIIEQYLQVDAIDAIAETDQPRIDARSAMQVGRGTKISGIIHPTPMGTAEEDWYRFDAREGEVWLLEVNAARSGSPLDSKIELRDADGERLLRVRLQAIRESYFTFRGKDSRQSNDFRLFGWEDMELDDLLYSSGEVTKLWMYPRGPDSGFNVYPGTGNRHTVFDTNPVTHALQEPAYVVRELPKGQPPMANGLPVFDIYYANDDDSLQQLGTDSRLRFVAPHTGTFTVFITDTRGLSGDSFKYDLTIRPASPDFVPSIDKIGQPIAAGSGREFRVSINRIDGFTGPVTFELQDLHAGVHATKQVIVEPGQHEAVGLVWIDEDYPADQDLGEPTVVARAEILGRVVEHKVGTLGLLKSAAKPRVRLTVTADADQVSLNSDPSTPVRLHMRPGETISAIVHVGRNGFEDEIKLGNEFSGRNMPHGVFVDNIGLNGLMVLKGADKHQFFIKASPIAAPTKRYFHLKAEMDGGIASLPVLLEITE